MAEFRSQSIARKKRSRTATKGLRKNQISGVMKKPRRNRGAWKLK